MTSHYHSKGIAILKFDEFESEKNEIWEICGFTKAYVGCVYMLNFMGVPSIKGATWHMQIMIKDVHPRGGFYCRAM